jgi:solute carrier family 25 phosphate transporter 3
MMKDLNDADNEVQSMATDSRHGKKEMIISRGLLQTVIVFSSFPIFSALAANLDFFHYAEVINFEDSVSHYSKYFLAGGISACTAHAVSTPFDVIKTCKQTTPRYSSMSIMEAAKLIAEENGVGYFKQGLGATISGYFIQGAIKFGGYEVLKPQILKIFTTLNLEDNKLLLFMLSAAIADTIGSSLLCPFEAARIRMIAKKNYAKNLIDGFKRMYYEEGLEGMYRGFPALFCKQIPFTVMQLSSYDIFTTKLYDWFDVNGKSFQVL